MIDQLDTPSLRMAWAEAPWDSKVCCYPVLQISLIQILGSDAGNDLHIFERERDRRGAGLVSCRLAHECMAESMLLEDHGFRFIEMLYQPELELPNQACLETTPRLDVSRARAEDLPVLCEIARTSFRNERFKMDPRLDSNVSDQRYQNWVSSSLQHASQQLYVIRDGNRVIAFFVTEMLEDATCYWHLNAVAPEAQGLGYGRRAWLSMLDQAAAAGAQRVRTSIVARNHRVLNLYSSLGFRFPPPLMTLHWVRNKP